MDNTSLVDSKKKRKSFFQAFLEKINPKSHFASGSPRMISIDFLRGISIFFLGLIHDTTTLGNVEGFYSQAGFTFVCVCIVAIPALLFAHWRSFFILISGITYAFTTFKKQKSWKRMSIELLVAELIGLIMAPLMFVLDYLYQLFSMWGKSSREQFGQENNAVIENPFVRPWYSVMRTPSTPLFFAALFLVIPILNFIIKLPFVLWSRLRPHVEQRIQACVYTTLAVGVAFSTNVVQFAVYQHLDKQYPGVLTGQYECSVDFLGDLYNIDGWTAVKHMCLSLIVGPHTYIFPFLASYLFGCAIGSFYASVKEHKRLIPAEQWRRTRKVYLLIHAFLFLVPLAAFGIQSAITMYDVKTQKRLKYQSILQVVELSMWVPCQQPEFLLFDTMLQFFAVFIGVLIFECGTKEQLEKRTNRSLYLRRFSTGSMTVYCYSLLLSNIVRMFLPYDPNSVGQAYLSLFIMAIVQFSAFLFLDKIDWAGTPDHILSSLSKVLLKRFVPNQFAAKNHLHVKSIGLFGREPDQLPAVL